MAVKDGARRIPAPISHLNISKKVIAFGWYGGKYSHSTCFSRCFPIVIIIVNLLAVPLLCF